eukprot:3496833-Rhodomonas_salina.1
MHSHAFSSPSNTSHRSLHGSIPVSITSASLRIHGRCPSAWVNCSISATECWRYLASVKTLSAHSGFCSAIAVHSFTVLCSLLRSSVLYRCSCSSPPESLPLATTP